VIPDHHSIKEMMIMRTCTCTYTHTPTHTHKCGDKIADFARHAALNLTERERDRIRETEREKDRKRARERELCRYIERK